MAPLRSSRSTRNQDHQVAARNRGVVDLDPTEGLPVQKWEQISVRVSQDPSIDPSNASNNQSAAAATSSLEWTAQFGTPQHPWPEKPLPTFFSQLPIWNQEMLRRSRAGNTSVKLSVWDRKTNSWISAAEAEKRQNPMKSVHLNNLDPSDANQATSGVPEEPVDHDDEEDNDEAVDDEIEGDNEDDNGGPSRSTPGVKRRKHTIPEDRAFEVKRWVQVPSAVAEKIEERKFLADRRPGMPSLYGGAYQNEIFGSLGLTQIGYSNNGASNNAYDLGDGAGLNNAIGSTSNDQGNATPVRRNMPPKRKKKKGGPGRRKVAANAQNSGSNASTNPTPSAPGQPATQGIPNLDGTNSQRDGDVVMQDGDESESDDSEGEGSEEGEVDERNNTQAQPEPTQNGHSDASATEPQAQEVPEPELQSQNHTQPQDLIIQPDPSTNTIVEVMVQDEFMQEAPNGSDTVPAEVPSIVEEVTESQDGPIKALVEVSAVPIQETVAVAEAVAQSSPKALTPAPAPTEQPEQLEQSEIPAESQQLQTIPDIPEIPAPISTDLTSETLLQDPEPDPIPETTTQPSPPTLPAPIEIQIQDISATAPEPTIQASVEAPEINEDKAVSEPVKEPQSAASEFDLLGGLEDQLDRDMRE